MLQCCLSWLRWFLKTDSESGISRISNGIRFSAAPPLLKISAWKLFEISIEILPSLLLKFFLSGFTIHVICGKFVDAMDPSSFQCKRQELFATRNFSVWSFDLQWKILSRSFSPPSKSCPRDIRRKSGQSPDGRGPSLSRVANPWKWKEGKRFLNAISWQP